MSNDVVEEKILDKVQKLLDKAWSTTFEEEKKSLLAKADALMMKYSIEQIMLLDPSRPNTARPIIGQEPVLRNMGIFPQEGYFNIEIEIRNGLRSMFQNLARHFGCRTMFGDYSWDIKVVGYPADIDFLDMMFLSLKLDFLKRVDPQVVSTISWEANLLALKQSGRKWEAIHQELQSHPAYPYKGMAWERRMGVRFTGIYKKWRDANPDEPANVSSPQMWREDFILGYCRRIVERLEEMREATLAASDNLPALLNDKASLVDAKFKDLFPPVPWNPGPSNGKPVRYRQPKYRAVSTAARAAGANAANKADLNQRNSRIGGNKGQLG